MHICIVSVIGSLVVGIDAYIGSVLALAVTLTLMLIMITTFLPLYLVRGSPVEGMKGEEK